MKNLFVDLKNTPVLMLFRSFLLLKNSFLHSQIIVHVKRYFYFDSTGVFHVKNYLILT